MPVHLTCWACGIAFTRTPHEFRGRTYCSSDCSLSGRRPQNRQPLPPLELTADGGALIPLRARDGSVRAHAIIDTADAEWANQWRWCLDKDGYVGRAEYLGGGAVNKRMRGVKLHRDLLGLVKGDGLEGDHIDRNRLNNRRSNLRIVTHLNNHQNRSSNRGASSTYRGVSWDRSRCKWCATIKINGKVQHLGYFTNEHEAGEAARSAREKLMPYSTD